jgi:hypothetical protein
MTDIAIRIKLPDRREAIIQQVVFERPGKRGEQIFEVGFGHNADGEIKEVFCTGGLRDASDIQALLHDGCVLMSYKLQCGRSFAEISKSMGELRDEGAESGPPASPLGAIARAGAALQAEINAGLACAQIEGVG